MVRSSEAMLRKLVKNRSEVNLVVKYILLGFNVLVWILGIVLIAIGIWAMVQKTSANNIYKLTNNSFDPVALFLITGIVIFFIGFFGCIGSLRENIPLLIIYIVFLVIILLALVVGVIIVFAFKDWLKERVLESSLKDLIPKYRDDVDLQNLVNWIQQEWLYCCGLDGPNDWEQNVYFNCSSPGIDSCGVPYSCCKPDLNQPSVQNTQCGNGVRSKELIISTLIYTQGCLEAGERWFNKYIIPIAGTVIVITVALILSICCAWNLIADVRAQKAKWRKF